MARAVLILSLIFATPAVAQPACAPIDSAFQALRDAFGEVPQVEWVDDSGNRFVVLASPEGSVPTMRLARHLLLFAVLIAPATAAQGWKPIDGDSIISPASRVIRIANIDTAEMEGAARASGPWRGKPRRRHRQHSTAPEALPCDPMSDYEIGTAARSLMWL